MSKVNKLIFGLLIVLLLVIVVFSTINDIRHGDRNIYILFDNDTLHAQKSWEDYSIYFPQDFDPQRAETDSGIDELTKLDKRQREIYDSIQKVIYPKKMISKETKPITYAIWISPKEEIKLESINSKSIEYSESMKLTYLPVDSLITLIPDVTVPMQESKNKSAFQNTFYVVLTNSSNSNAKLEKVIPRFVTYE